MVFYLSLTLKTSHFCNYMQYWRIYSEKLCRSSDTNCNYIPWGARYPLHPTLNISLPCDIVAVLFSDRLPTQFPG